MTLSYNDLHDLSLDSPFILYNSVSITLCTNITMDNRSIHYPYDTFDFKRISVMEVCSCPPSPASRPTFRHPLETSSSSRGSSFSYCLDGDESDTEGRHIYNDYGDNTSTGTSEVPQVETTAKVNVEGVGNQYRQRGNSPHQQLQRI